ncbi:MAG TPA: TRAFs-binding domain-containing protein [Pyrinomonadaceae bacterium]|nr:TRAFs-binding domain-containing protein [Pyrinomonadaceae bacterium]
MSEEISEKEKGTCFVVMGFGKKTDFETGRTLDLDKSYKNMIKPAVEEAGLKCIRADEIVHSGLIDVPMYEQLLNADVVVADLSTSNKNAFYELGVRHALRPFTTVVIAEDGIKTFPFDVNHILIRQYHHLGEDIGYEEVMRFRAELTKAIKEVFEKDPRDKDSPVYTLLNDLTPPAIAAAVQSAVQASTGEDINSAQKANLKALANEKQIGTPNAIEDDILRQNHSALMEQVDEAQKQGDFVKAKSLLKVIYQLMEIQAPDKPKDPYIIQRLALVTYKSRKPTQEEALKEARELLAILEPETSNDTETLGLWGAVHKRLWNLTKDTLYLDEAVRAYERGFYLRNDYYNGINFAFMLNERAANTEDTAEAIADFVQARRVRKEVLTICEQWLEANPSPDPEKSDKQTVTDYQKNRYWVLATMAEAYLGLGDEAKANQILEDANKQVPEIWMKESAREQVDKLKSLLLNSPLENIKTDTLND